MTKPSIPEVMKRIADEHPIGTKIIYVLTGLRNDPVGYFIEGEIPFGAL